MNIIRLYGSLCALASNEGLRLEDTNHLRSSFGATITTKTVQEMQNYFYVLNATLDTKYKTIKNTKIQIDIKTVDYNRV